MRQCPQQATSLIRDIKVETNLETVKSFEDQSHCEKHEQTPPSDQKVMTRHGVGAGVSSQMMRDIRATVGGVMVRFGHSRRSTTWSSRWRTNSLTFSRSSMPSALIRTCGVAWPRCSRLCHILSDCFWTACRSSDAA